MSSDSKVVLPELPDHIDAAVLKIAGVVVIGAIMSILDITVVNVALPTFQTVFGSVAHPLAYSHGRLVGHRVHPRAGNRDPVDRLGGRPVRHQAGLDMTAIALFVSGSVLCALSWSIGALIGFRVLQGLGGGMLMPLGMTIMTRQQDPTGWAG